MAGVPQRGASRRRVGERGASIALIDGAGSDEGVVAVLEELDLAFERSASVPDLIAHGGEAAVVVLRTAESLARAAADDLTQLRRDLPGTPVVVICDEIRPGELRAALAAGAVGVVLEGQLAVTLGTCLQAAGAGQVCVPKRHAPQVEPAALSAREKQILGLVVMGYMNSEIGERLFVAESTVKSHLSSAFVKLGVRSRNEAVELILDPERGLGMGILELGGERVETKATAR
jgi:DNA-binding NarL/FixJ family response regulator